MSTTPLLNPGPPQVSKQVMRLVRQAIRDFDLIEPGDHVAVGVSGGKDSLLLARAMKELLRHDDLDFSLSIIHLDQNQPGFDRQGFNAAMELLELEVEIIDKDTHSIVQSLLKPGQIPCAVCGRLRRGILNQFCHDRGINKLALGHHLDDGIETFFLNLLFGRRLDPLKAATPASELEVTTIRPLILVEERKIRAWVEEHQIPVVACPSCDDFPNSKRREVKHLIQNFQQTHPEVHESVRSALYES